MPRAPLRILFILGSLLVSALAIGQVKLPIMPVSEIKPGMKGYGLTVFRGEVPEKFDIEVIDVLHNFRPDQDLILIRTPHPVLDRAIAVGGMSGSPVFIDGKMIGAYAYGWQFGKEPIAGVTPIANMLREIARPVDPRIWKALGTLPTPAAKIEPKPSPSPRLAGLAPDFGQERATAWSALRAHGERHGVGREVQRGHVRLTQASTPIMVSGMSESAIDVLGGELERFGLVTVQAGGGGAVKNPDTKTAPSFVDGGSIGVQLIRGDINATGVGTVTHVEGDRLVAFGHPMMNAGQIGLPTSTSRVLHVLSSEMRSFKIAEAVAPYGTMVHDRQSAIVVDKRLKADMVPVSLRIKGVPGAPRSEWNVEVANNRLLTPSLTFSAIFSALGATASDNADVVFKIKSRVSIEGHGTVETEDHGYTSVGAGDPLSLSRLRLFSVLSAVYGNPFEDTRITKIDLEAELDFGRNVVEVIDAMVPSEEVDPGKTVNVYVTLRKDGEREETKIIPVRIPESAAGGSVEIALDPGDEVKVEKPKPQSLSDLLDAVRDGYAGTSLVVGLRLPSQGMRMRGQLVSSLPGSALDTLSPVSKAERGSTFATYARTEVPLGHVVTGSARVKVNVRREPLR